MLLTRSKPQIAMKIPQPTDPCMSNQSATGPHTNGGAAGHERQREGQTAQQQRLRHARDPETDASQQALRKGRSDQSVDDALDRHADDREQPPGARSCNALTDLAHESDQAATVQEQEKGDEYTEREFEKTGTECRTASESDICNRTSQLLEFDNKCGRVMQ